MTDPVETLTPAPAAPHAARPSVTERQATAARAVLKKDKAGTAYVLRFPLLVRVLHILLLIAITVLALTGLAQVFHGNFVGTFLLRLLGGLDRAQAIHHAFSILLGVVVFFHLLDILESIFVRRQVPAILPSSRDVADARQMLKYNLGRSELPPRFGRYTLEQKLVYFAVALGILLLGTTGLMRLFPIQVTEFLPGILLAYAGILHRWSAILVILVVFIGHLYQVHIRQHNLSIFTGRMSYAEMQVDHPRELEYLLHAANATANPNLSAAGSDTVSENK